MGIGFALVIWAFVGTALAAIGAVVLGSAAAYLTRGAGRGRDKLVKAARLFPFICLGWGAAVFIFQAVVNETVLHRDAGVGDLAYCPLPNGYAIVMIDVPDLGWVYNPKTQDVEGSFSGLAEATVLQVAGKYIFGGDHPIDPVAGNRTAQAESYFVLDSQSGKSTRFATYEGLQAYARRMGVRLSLESIESIYSKYRFTAFDVFAALLFLVPLLIGCFILIMWLFRVRRTRPFVQVAA